MTLGLLQDKLPLTLYTLPVTLHFYLLSDIRQCLFIGGNKFYITYLVLFFLFCSGFSSCFISNFGELLFNCDDDVTFDKRSLEYQNYPITREHTPSTVKRQFFEIRNKTRAEARTKQEKRDKVSNVKFIITYNPALPNINKIIQNNLSILHTGEDMKKRFPSN